MTKWKSAVKKWKTCAKRELTHLDINLHVRTTHKNYTKKKKKRRKKNCMNLRFQELSLVVWWLNVVKVKSGSPIFKTAKAKFNFMFVKMKSAKKIMKFSKKLTSEISLVLKAKSWKLTWVNCQLKQKNWLSSQKRFVLCLKNSMVWLTLKHVIVNVIWIWFQIKKASIVLSLVLKLSVKSVVIWMVVDILKLKLQYLTMKPVVLLLVHSTHIITVLILIWRFVLQLNYTWNVWLLVEWKKFMNLAVSSVTKEWIWLIIQNSQQWNLMKLMLILKISWIWQKESSNMLLK